MRRVHGYFQRDPRGHVVFVIRRERCEGELLAWEPDPFAVVVDVATTGNVTAQVAAQQVAAQLWALEHREAASAPPSEPVDEEVLDVLELGSPPAVDPMEVPDGATA